MLTLYIYCSIILSPLDIQLTLNYRINFNFYLFHLFRFELLMKNCDITDNIFYFFKIKAVMADFYPRETVGPDQVWLDNIALGNSP